MADTDTRQTPENAVPDAATEAEPKGLPTSDRHQSETAAAGNGGKPAAEKHSHS